MPLIPSDDVEGCPHAGVQLFFCTPIYACVTPWPLLAFSIYHAHISSQNTGDPLQFVFTPHYAKVPYVVGIAIAGDMLSMITFGPQGVKETAGPFNLSTRQGCIM